jgi:hypothetical protein
MSIGLPKQRDRMAALAAAKIKMSAIVSENQITAALAHKVPSSVDRTYEVGEEVLVFREKEKKWTGQLHMGTWPLRGYSVDQWKLLACRLSLYWPSFLLDWRLKVAVSLEFNEWSSGALQLSV